MNDGRPDETEEPARRPADTGDKVARLAADYHNVTIEQLEVMMSTPSGREHLMRDIHSMAGSLRRQNER
jgi:hypothetical protein